MSQWLVYYYCSCSSLKRHVLEKVNVCACVHGEIIGHTLKTAVKCSVPATGAEDPRTLLKNL